jgi:hypothetical protein
VPVIRGGPRTSGARSAERLGPTIWLEARRSGTCTIESYLQIAPWQGVFVHITGLIAARLSQRLVNAAPVDCRRGRYGRNGEAEGYHDG